MQAGMQDWCGRYADEIIRILIYSFRARARSRSQYVEMTRWLFSFCLHLAFIIHIFPNPSHKEVRLPVMALSRRFDSVQAHFVGSHPTDVGVEDSPQRMTKPDFLPDYRKLSEICTVYVRRQRKLTTVHNSMDRVPQIVNHSCGTYWFESSCTNFG